MTVAYRGEWRATFKVWLFQHLVSLLRAFRLGHSLSINNSLTVRTNFFFGLAIYLCLVIGSMLTLN